MCSLSMYNHNRVTVNAADSLLDGGIHLKEAKKKCLNFFNIPHIGNRVSTSLPLESGQACDCFN